jgi:hypothetical protein
MRALEARLQSVRLLRVVFRLPLGFPEGERAVRLSIDSRQLKAALPRPLMHKNTAVSHTAIF